MNNLLNLILTLLSVNLTFTILIKHTTVILDISRYFYTKLNPNKPYNYQLLPKPFSCEFCLIFWFSVYFLYKYFVETRNFELNTLFIITSTSLLNSIGSQLINNLIVIIKILIDKTNPLR